LGLARLGLERLGLKHGFKAGVHFFFFDKLAALGCRNPFSTAAREGKGWASVPANFPTQAKRGLEWATRGYLISHPRIRLGRARARPFPHDQKRNFFGQRSI
jgi:hypothetical protein